MDYLQLLKKHKRDADRSRALWSGTTPVLKCAYSRNCGEFMFHVSPAFIIIVIEEKPAFIANSEIVCHGN